MLLIALQFVATCILLVVGLLVLSGIVIMVQFSWALFINILEGEHKDSK